MSISIFNLKISTNLRFDFLTFKSRNGKLSLLDSGVNFKLGSKLLRCSKNVFNLSSPCVQIKKDIINVSKPY